MPGFYDAIKEVVGMSDKYIRTLRRIALDGLLTAEAAEKLIRAHANDWREDQHPKGKGGRFAPKGSGSVSGGCESSDRSGSGNTASLIPKPPAKKYARKPEKGSGRSV